MADITYRVEEPAEARNRLTTGFRLILAIPHLLLVGGPGLGWGLGSDKTGVFSVVAAVSAVINWFAIVFTGKAINGLLDLQLMYLRWRANALAYMALLRDEYPPFGEGDYPVTSDFPRLETDRNRWTVGLRLILIIPQAIVYFFLFIAWFVTAIIGWFAILFTGQYPPGLWRFAEGTLRWGLRIEAYLLLLHDSYPPFSLDEQPASGEGETA